MGNSDRLTLKTKVLFYGIMFKLFSKLPTPTNRLFFTASKGWIKQLEGKYSLESTDPRESEIRAHLRP